MDELKAFGPLNLDEAELRQRDREAALEYIERNLEDEQRISVEQATDCQLTAVVPVMGEQPENLLKLAASFAAQEGLSPDAFEAIFVINNGRANIVNREEIVERNRQVLALPIWRNTSGAESNVSIPEPLRQARERLRLFVVDKRDANVGKARDRGIAEAAVRYDVRDRNGLIFQTDADCRLPDPSHFSRLIKLFSENPQMIALGGIVRFEFAPDTNEDWHQWPKERIRTEWQNIVLLRAVKSLSQSLDLESVQPEQKGGLTSLPGANMVARSFESAVVGGVGGKSASEDTEFRDHLNAYAQARSKECRMDQSFGVLTAARESTRVSEDLRGFAQRDAAGEPLINDIAFHQGLVPVKTLYRQMREQLLSTPRGREVFEYFRTKFEQAYIDPTGENDFSFLETF